MTSRHYFTDQTEKIDKLLDQGLSISLVAERLGVTKQTIRRRMSSRQDTSQRLPPRQPGRKAGARSP